MCHLLPLSSDVAFKTSVNVVDNPTLVISSETERLVFFKLAVGSKDLQAKRPDTW